MRKIGFNRRGTIFKRSRQFVCFADDLNTIGRTYETVADLYTRNASRAGQILADRTCVGTSVTIEVDSFKVMVLHAVFLPPLKQELSKLCSEPRAMNSNFKKFLYTNFFGSSCAILSLLGLQRFRRTFLNSSCRSFSDFLASSTKIWIKISHAGVPPTTHFLCCKFVRKLFKKLYSNYLSSELMKLITILHELFGVFLETEQTHDKGTSA